MLKNSSTKYKETEIGLIPEEWSVLSVQQVSGVVGGGTPSTTDGDNFGGDIPWITPRDLSGYSDRYISHGERNITEKGLNSSSARKLPAKTVLLTTRAPVGYLAISQNEVTTNQGFHSMIPNGKTDAYFLFYLLKCNVQKLIDHASGSTFQELSGKTLKSLAFAFPEISEQKEISEILSSLDDKIELNRKINANLEKLAAALFKKWFVDIGDELPKGWRVVRFTDVVDILSGGTPKTSEKQYWNGDIPFFTPKDAGDSTYTFETEKYITQIGLESCNSSLYPINTTFISARGTVGKVAMAGIPMAMNQSCYALRGKADIGPYFVYELTKRTAEELKQKAHGSVFSTITIPTFSNASFKLPHSNLIKGYENSVEPIYEMIRENSKENGKLIFIRDSLLPRLMSGKIRVAK